jgi:hypothetical protein
MRDAELDFDCGAKRRRRKPAASGRDRGGTRQAKPVKQSRQQDHAIPQQHDIADARNVVAGDEPEETRTEKKQCTRSEPKASAGTRLAWSGDRRGMEAGLKH